ncbi:hypothetical protein GCM10018781_15560 [Kitasatospora indigofera]|uniref:Uncharacterized protein n=1 Tax=Kitasatospora indigofera TaxID=67307 RepID=A0A919KME9_9ACTN|nr:hypothetical protein GCM10018781_15560 [Kitasatospora indigofera]
MVYGFCSALSLTGSVYGAARGPAAAGREGAPARFPLCPLWGERSAYPAFPARRSPVPAPLSPFPRSSPRSLSIPLALRPPPSALRSPLSAERRARDGALPPPALAAGPAGEGRAGTDRAGRPRTGCGAPRS